MHTKQNVTADHFKGAASELKAAEWFLSNNSQVYFPTVQQTAIDFVADYQGFKSVQVKTATLNKSGGKSYLQCRTRLTNKYQDFKPSDLYDLLAVVYNTELWIIPSKVIESSNISLWAPKWDIYKVK